MAAVEEIQAQRETAVTRMHNVGCKTELVTVANAQIVLLKGARAIYTTMSHLDQAAVHHWRPKHVIPYIHRGYRGEDGKRNYLHLKHPSVVQIFAFCHANSISMN